MFFYYRAKMQNNLLHIYISFICEIPQFKFRNYYTRVLHTVCEYFITSYNKLFNELNNSTQFFNITSTKYKIIKVPFNVGNSSRRLEIKLMKKKSFRMESVQRFPKLILVKRHQIVLKSFRKCFISRSDIKDIKCNVRTFFDNQVKI